MGVPEKFKAERYAAPFPHIWTTNVVVAEVAHAQLPRMRAGGRGLVDAYGVAWVTHKLMVPYSGFFGSIPRGVAQVLTYSWRSWLS